ANRHLLKAAPVSRLVTLAVSYLQNAEFVENPSTDGLEYLEGILPIATGSIDRLHQGPDLLRPIFRFDAAAAAARPEVLAEFESDGAKAVARAFAEDLAS